jgi:hypothetical protein
MRKASPNRRSCGLATLLSVCQAISIAITTVLPVPVAILCATRNRPGLASSAKVRSWFSIHARRSLHLRSLWLGPVERSPQSCP